MLQLKGGGGIFAGDESTTKLVNSQVTGNKAILGDGGGIRVAGGKLILQNSKVTGNSATGGDGGGNGGGIDAQKYSVLDIADSTIADNDRDVRRRRHLLRHVRPVRRHATTARIPWEARSPARRSPATMREDGAGIEISPAGLG